MTNPSSPHDWKMPTVGDTELVCVKPACGRRLPYGRMSPNIRASIMGAQYRLGGEQYGDAFKAAFTATHEALSPRTAVFRETPDTGYRFKPSLRSVASR